MARFRNFYSQLLCIFTEGKIKAIQLVNAHVIVQTVLFSLLSFFSVFTFSMPSKGILTVKEFMFLSINTGQLTGCGGADLHNSPTSAFSASVGHFSAQN